MSYTSSGVGASIGSGNLDIRERLDSIERGDSLAPATVRISCSGGITVPPASNITLPIIFVEQLRGRVFEFLATEGALRIRQGGVIGFIANVVGVATGPGNFVVVMVQEAPPYHAWLLIRMPFNNQPSDYLTYTAGGTQLVDVPENGADYRVTFYNVGGPGSFTVYNVSASLVYLGLR